MAGLLGNPRSRLGSLKFGSPFTPVISDTGFPDLADMIRLALANGVGFSGATSHSPMFSPRYTGTRVSASGTYASRQIEIVPHASLVSSARAALVLANGAGFSWATSHSSMFSPRCTGIRVSASKTDALRQIEIVPNASPVSSTRAV